MTEELTKHRLTEKFFDLTMLFYLEMQQKDAPSMLFQGQGNILMALGKNDHQSQKELSQNLHISAPSVNEFVNKLVKKGLVNKVKSSTDKRVSIVSLTDEGHRSLNNINQSELSGWDYLDNHEQAEFAQLMDKMTKQLSQKYDNQIDKRKLSNLKQKMLKITGA